MQKLLFRVVCALALALSVTPAFAAFTQYDTELYDLETNGVPKFVDHNYIDLRKVTQISKFRSSAGHDYSDSTQFGQEGVIIQFIGRESCRSMKHYFIAPDASVKIYAPTSGVVSRRFDEAIGGTQLQITSDVQGAFTFLIFHVVLTGDFPVGSRVEAGQLLGHHTGPQTFSDIAVQVHTPKGYKHVSYFETLTDSAFAAFQTRGVQTREQLIYTLEQRQADRFTCSGTRFVNLKVPAEQDYFNLTGGAQTQTITATPTPTSLYARPTDPPLTFAATASSGLPVTLNTNAPRVCAVSGMTVTFRRKGECLLTLTQDGTEDVFAAPTLRYYVYNYPTGTQVYPRIGGVFVPGASPTLSMLRVYAGGAGTVTVALLNGDTGATVATWTSPQMAAGSERQFAITDLEGAASAPFTRPSVYGLQVISGVYGSIQHVLFNTATSVLTNASSCSAGIVGNPVELMGVHSSRFTGFPSALAFLNSRGPQNIFPFVQLRNSDTGSTLGFGYSAESPDHSAIHPFAQFNYTSNLLETGANVSSAAMPLHYSLYTANFGFGDGYVSHHVNNIAGGMVSDMTAHCDLGGFGHESVLTPVATGSIYSGQNVTSTSFLRFYNSGTVAGTVTVALREPVYGNVLGYWTSPAIAGNAEVQVPISTVEDSITGLTKLSNYTVAVYSAFEGAFQHILWKAPSGGLSNASTCGGGSTLDHKTAIAVHSGLMAGAGFPSTVIVNNLGDSAAPATLNVFDAATGNRLGGFTTAAIPAGAQALFESTALETRAGFDGTGKLHYIVKLDAGYNGYLQHYVSSRGTVTDMSLTCGM